MVISNKYDDDAGHLQAPIAIAMSMIIEMIANNWPDNVFHWTPL